MTAEIGKSYPPPPTLLPVYTVCPKKGYPLKSGANAERSNLNALTPK